jgi:hypothetical protein
VIAGRNLGIDVHAHHSPVMLLFPIIGAIAGVGVLALIGHYTFRRRPERDQN